MKTCLTFLIFIPLLLAGCATRGDIRKLREENMRAQERAEEQFIQLVQGIALLDSLLRDQGETIRRMGADLGTEVTTLNERISALEGRVVETGSRLSRLGQKVETSSIYGGSRPQERSSSKSDTLRPPTDVVSLQDPKRLYDAAYQDMVDKNYPFAIAQFSQYIATYPSTELSDNAQYWLGECYYAQKNYKKARESFQKLLTTYHDSDKIPAALLKIGYTFAEENDRTGAIKHLQTLIKNYPKTEEAQKAQQKIKELSSKRR
ncbi:MAG: tol-pal system protein YbgF [Candidatus Latescibacteria bacterium]|nr:tol-pal system protein YbgF [Candidatus Latescibacterota bacterium]